MVYKEGSVRVLDQNTQEYRVAEPGTMWYSTITMAAQEVFLNGKWQPIWPDDAADQGE